MKIEIWSDYVCPFCYIGEHRLQKALEVFPNRDGVSIEYKCYELDPNAKAIPDMDYYTMLSKKMGTSVDQVKQFTKSLKQQAAELGLTYNFDQMQHTNTFDAHRLAKYAESQGKGKEMTERLFRAHFTEGKLLGDKDVLIELAESVGIDKEDAVSVLASNEKGRKVREDEEQARELGVQGVPFFVFNKVRCFRCTAY
ncbi:DsbA family oxidoreductase [Virgibacillus sp. 179-BFC.A HS]|uniref:DsbA family oxidoreductase n=1 Tax=Tigheibacillus jepli TaxID=3035914 RepID=A0ABU5CKW9_9BACI|nr:DsbA family oxidoreductase [Virgibacillus sp. 179-BFC.A HS]MDY0406965.1 DsbA family oxidoreductase [Virgibacillus sp. 179-BFC.A HS]